MNELENNSNNDKEIITRMNDERQSDYSFYTWYKGEAENPYSFDTFHPLAAPFWELERRFHMEFMSKSSSSMKLPETYESWKNDLFNKELHDNDYLSVLGDYGNELNITNWSQSFETGKLMHPSKNS